MSALLAPMVDLLSMPTSTPTPTPLLELMPQMPMPTPPLPELMPLAPTPTLFLELIPLAPTPTEEAEPGAAGADSETQASPAIAPGEEVSRYYVANILKANLAVGEEVSVATACERDRAHRETVPGGYYVVFWVADDLEAYSLVDAFRLLTRCAFGGWIRDNRWRVDFWRRTFIEWRARKLYFYVPTIG